MVNRISALPNFFNGKLYKRWDRVSTFFGENTILASKVNKKGESVELLIHGNGKRELLSDTYKVMDLIGEDNIHRTYSYQRTPRGIKGKMFVEKTKDKPQPLVTAANWLVENLVPKEVHLTLNPSHPKANMFVKVDSGGYSFNKFREVVVKEINADAFMDTLSPRPSKMKLTLQDGSVLESRNPAQGNIFVSNSKENKAEIHPIDYINVVV